METRANYVWVGAVTLGLLAVLAACRELEVPSIVATGLLTQAQWDEVCAKALALFARGREMAAGVSETLAHILAPTGLTPAMLRAEGRYVEDVY